MIETLFYMLEIAVLKGKQKDAQLYLDLLRHEYEINEDNFDILKDDERFEELHKMGNIVDNNLFVKSINLPDEQKLEINRDEHQVTKEKKLVELICKSGELKQSLNASEEFQFSSPEFPTAYGRVDLIAQDKEKLFVIEVKRDTAKHDVIGQIQKYMLHFKIRRIYKLWKKVIGIVIANSFDKYTINELTNQNVMCLKYMFKRDILKLEVI